MPCCHASHNTMTTRSSNSHEEAHRKDVETAKAETFSGPDAAISELTLYQSHQQARCR